MRNEVIEEEAQAPQTPGLVEVSNLTQLACDDHHMGVEDLNADEGRNASRELDANEMHKHDNDLPSEYNAGEAYDLISNQSSLSLFGRKFITGSCINLFQQIVSVSHSNCLEW